MSTIDLESVADALQELSSIDLQRRLWLSTGAGNSDVSSFNEAVEKLYTDTGLSDSINAGSTGFSKEVIELFVALQGMLKQVEYQRGPLNTINSHMMSEIRETAAKLLRMLEGNKGDREE